jgi:hypothetical protein
MTDCITDAGMAVMMWSRMRVVEAGVISRTAVGGSGSRGHACLSMSVIERHDPG